MILQILAYYFIILPFFTIFMQLTFFKMKYKFFFFLLPYLNQTLRTQHPRYSPMSYICSNNRNII